MIAGLKWRFVTKDHANAWSSVAPEAATRDVDGVNAPREVSMYAELLDVRDGLEPLGLARLKEHRPEA